MMTAGPMVQLTFSHTKITKRARKCVSAVKTMIQSIAFSQGFNTIPLVDLLD